MFKNVAYDFNTFIIYIWHIFSQLKKSVILRNLRNVISVISA